jgi:hypothetical protein
LNHGEHGVHRENQIKKMNMKKCEQYRRNFAYLFYISVLSVFSLVRGSCKPYFFKYFP